LLYMKLSWKADDVRGRETQVLRDLNKANIPGVPKLEMDISFPTADWQLSSASVEAWNTADDHHRSPALFTTATGDPSSPRYGEEPDKDDIHLQSNRIAARHLEILILSPVGRSLRSDPKNLFEVFRTPKELFSKMKRLLDTITRAFAVGWYHRDLSPSNLIHVESTGELVLNDWGNAAKRGSPSLSARQYDLRQPRTGTLAFMAYEVLVSQSATFRYRLRHDLESLSYLLIYFLENLVLKLRRINLASGLPMGITPQPKHNIAEVRTLRFCLWSTLEPKSGYDQMILAIDPGYPTIAKCLSTMQNLPWGLRGGESDESDDEALAKKTVGGI